VRNKLSDRSDLSRGIFAEGQATPIALPRTSAWDASATAMQSA
jgi:hypothetical protein